MSLFSRARNRVLGAGLPALLLGSMLTLLQSPAALADTAPADPSLPSTVSADALPAPQIDGVVWAQAIVGNTVYAGGSFANARPAGSAPGTNQVPRANLLSYDLTTGNLNSWAPVLNGQVLALAGSPDGSRLYVGGDFTNADGINKYRILAYNTATGTLDNTFSPTLDYRVDSIVATASTVFVGGAFKTVNGQTRADIAAFQASNGALLSWNPVLDGQVKTMVLTPDGSRLIVGGEMQNINSVAAYGMGSIDVATGATEPWAVNKVIMDSGANGGITTLSSDGSYIYGGGYKFGTGANFEGTFQADPMTGNIVQLEDCHGDTYGTYEMGGVMYEVGHSHMCNNIGAFPETPTRTWHRTLAYDFKQTPTCTVQHNTIGNYADWYGYQCPTQLDWYPTLVSGTFTGQDQAAWTVTGNGQYLVEGGEFPSVNGIPQQGLVRFAIPSIAPNKMGPVNTGASFVPQVTSQTPGTVKISFPADWDQDNTALTYQIVRNSNKATPVYTTTLNSTFWQTPTITFTDTGLTPGQTYKYRVYATDPFGNQAIGDNVNVTVATNAPSAYANTVLSDGAGTYYRLDEQAGSPVAYDWAGYEHGLLGTGVTEGTAGAIAGDTDTGATFDGAADGTLAYPDQIQAPNTFSLEAWINTTTTTGGKIIGFGTAQTGNSLSYDRQIYMDNAGHLVFGVYNNKIVSLISAGTYNDGKWHHIVATLGSGGTALYVDAHRVGYNASNVSAQNLNGWWRIGGDTLAGSWPNLPSSAYFKGSIDDVAIYPKALASSQIANHFTAGSGQVLTVGGPPADPYGAGVYNTNPSFYWRLGETAGTTANDATINGYNGVYAGGVTFGTPGAVKGSADTAVTFNGTNGTVGAPTTSPNPTTYSEELWFKTTTKTGGKLIGFGNSQTGNSTTYDRHVYMLNTGQLRFGTYDGANRHTIDSPKAYNDGTWHYLVATEASDGMKLYVDGVVVASNAITTAQNFAGYWRVGGDSISSSWGGATTGYFAGSIDEAAVYGFELNTAQIANHFDNGGGQLPPTASFAYKPNGSTVSFDATGSTDPDGPIATYAWNFGDGTTGTGLTAQHTYATAGTYTVTLAVTDARNVSATTTSTLTTTNLPPTASFAATANALTANFDGTASSDADGSVATYAWDFGDGSTAGGATTQHAYAVAGTYTVTLTVTDNQGATASTSASITITPPPVASFVSTSNGLTAAFDGSGSTDPTGQITSYAWNFGDGTTGSGATAQHAYAAGGTYTVTLTVTDYNNGTNSVTNTVTVVPPNVPPTASFKTSVNGLAVAVDATASNDSDGTIASYAWNFGDGATGSGVTTQHTYIQAGSYAVTLTVTDNQAASTSTTTTVTVAPTTVYAKDTFARTTTTGFGIADQGGTWTVGGSAANYNVANGTGNMTMSAAGASNTAYLGGVSATDTKVTVGVSLNTAQTGGGTYLAVIGRRVSSGNDYRLKIKVASTGAVTEYLEKFASNSETALTTVPVAGLIVNAGDVLQVAYVVTGTNPTKMSAMVWKQGSTQPSAWQTTTTDATAALQVAGAVGVYDALSGSSTNAPEKSSFSNFWAGPSIAPNQPPTASFTTSANGLVANFDGTASNDPDGTIASYAWNFGDGTTGTGMTAQHTYAAAGTYTATLTVTDNVGASNTASNTVTVAPANQPPVASFTSSANGLTATVDATASTDPDGSIASYAWNFGDGAAATGMTAQHTYTAGGTYTVTLTVTDNQGATNTASNTVAVAAPNQPPTAAFTSSSNGLVASFDGSTSSDPDGTVASFAWSFGDGSTATGATTQHTYAAAGTYAVSLTVTDNTGATNTATSAITAAAANQAPIASFASSSAGLAASFDGTASHDPDGTIATYAWNFGDGTTGSGATTSHTYAAAGTYAVSLTVTDNQGATGTTAASMTVSNIVAPPMPYATDSFNRTVANGFGAATQGGNWTIAGTAANYNVNNGTGNMTVTAAGGTSSAYLSGVSSTTTKTLVSFSLSQPATGGGTYVSVVGRRISGNNDYRVKIKIAATGAVTEYLESVVNGTETSLQTLTVPGLTYNTGDVLNVALQVSGTSPTNLSAMVWKQGTTQPAAWQVNATDSTASLQNNGAVGLMLYLSGSTTNAPVTASFSNLWAGPLS